MFTPFWRNQFNKLSDIMTQPGSNLKLVLVNAYKDDERFDMYLGESRVKSVFSDRPKSTQDFTAFDYEYCMAFYHGYKSAISVLRGENYYD